MTFLFLFYVCKFTGKDNNMLFWNKICGLAIFFVIVNTISYAQNLDSALLARHVFRENKINLTDSSILSSLSPLRFNKLPGLIPAGFSTCKFGFFCRQELVIEKTTKIPFRFRLGSLKLCNYYEGK
jgi:hypothetical protein